MEIYDYEQETKVKKRRNTILKSVNIYCVPIICLYHYAGNSNIKNINKDFIDSEFSINIKIIYFLQSELVLDVERKLTEMVIVS